VAILCALAGVFSVCLPLAAETPAAAIGKPSTVTEVALSPGGTQVAYLLRVPRPEVVGEDEAEWTELHLVDLEGNSTPLLTGETTLHRIGWTPDGKAISFLARRSGDKHAAVYVFALDRKEMRSLAYHLADIPRNGMGYPEDEEPVRLVYHLGDIYDYAFSSDSDRVAFLAREVATPEEEAEQPVRVWVTDHEDIERHRALELPGSASQLRWSPTGSQLAVTVTWAQPGANRQGEVALLVVNPESGEIDSQFETDGKPLAVAWNKAGDWLALIPPAAPQQSTEGGLRLVRTAEGEAGQLVNLKLPARALAWMDTDTVMFLSGEDHRTSFGRVDRDGSEQRIIFSSDEVVFTDFSLAADGLSAAFLGEPGAGGGEVYFVKHGDTAPRRLTRPHQASPLTAEEIRRRRIDVLLPQALEEHDFDLWLVFTREAARDPMGPDIAADQVVARSAFLFARTPEGFRKVAIVASYDVAPVQESDIYDEVIAYRAEGVKPHLKKLIQKWDPARIAINTSRDVPTADGLTLGMRDYLEEALGPGYAGRFASAQPIVVSFRGRRLPEEVVILREAALYTDKILREALSEEVITPGQTTESDVATYLARRTEESGAAVAFVSVVVGKVRGHGGPSQRVIEPGDLVRIDFGITHRGYSTDVQRTAYVLRAGEAGAPAEIQRMWETCRAATDAAIAAMRPGVTGLSIDTVARQMLIAAGYQGYPHGAGHAIGFDVHDVGPILGPDWPERYGSTVHLKLEKDQTFAVEPILYAEYEGVEINIGLEEDVVVTADGVERLHPRQDELFLIRFPE